MGQLQLRQGPRISIHALCEEGDLEQILLASPVGISIHALCVEGDPLNTGGICHDHRFLSTPSARRATTGY